LKVLVTGATGFIGSHLMPRLARRHDVVALARREVVGARWVAQDLRDPFAFEEPVDAVVHLAQSRRYRELPEGTADVHAVNVESTRRLLELAHRASARVFVLASSGSVYAPRDKPLVESDPVDDSNAYAASKLAAEELVADYADSFAAAVLRFFTVYGPGQHGRLVADLIERVVIGKPIAVRNLRLSPTYVEDAVRAVEAALSVEKHVVANVAGDEAMTLAELVAAIEHLTGRTAIVEPIDDEPVSLVGANDCLKRVLRAPPVWTFERGLAATVGALGL